MFEACKNPNQQGNVGMCYAMAYYSKLGWTISVPITDSQDYDIIVDTGEDLFKVQIKTTNYLDDGVYSCSLRTSTRAGDIKDFENNSSNLLFVLTGSGDCYSIPKKEITAKTTINLGKKYSQYKVDLF